jgi:hypothetical protein
MRPVVPSGTSLPASLPYADTPTLRYADTSLTGMPHEPGGGPVPWRRGLCRRRCWRVTSAGKGGVASVPSDSFSFSRLQREKWDGTELPPLGKPIQMPFVWTNVDPSPGEAASPACPTPTRRYASHRPLITRRSLAWRRERPLEMALSSQLRPPPLARVFFARSESCRVPRTGRASQCGLPVS